MINHLHWVSMDGFVYFIVFHTWCFCFRFGHFTYYCFRRIRCCCPKHFRCSFWTHLMWSCMSLENRSRRNVSGTQCYTQSLLNVANLSNSDCKPFFNTLGYLSLHLCKHAELSTKILSPLNSTDISIHGGLCALKIVRRKVKVHHTESIVTFAWQMSTFFIFSGNNFCQMNLFEFALRCISFKLPEQTNQ